MWIFSVTGFYSVVTDSMRKGRVLIRARTKTDLDNLSRLHRQVCPSMEPSILDEAGDYRWSLSITKDDWVTLVGVLAAAVNYSNFKDAVHKRKDQRSKAAAYLEIWRVMRQVAFDGEERGARRSPAKRKVGVLASPRKKQKPKKAEKKRADVKDCTGAVQ